MSKVCIGIIVVKFFCLSNKMVHGLKLCANVLHSLVICCDCQNEFSLVLWTMTLLQNLPQIRGGFECFILLISLLFHIFFFSYFTAKPRMLPSQRPIISILLLLCNQIHETSQMTFLWYSEPWLLLTYAFPIRYAEGLESFLAWISLRCYFLLLFYFY